MMKKFAMAAIAAAAMGAGVAQAYTTGTFANGFVVPNVIHNGSADTTAVGLISIAKASVYWTFFDQNSNHVTDGCFEMSANKYTPFVWSESSGLGLEGKRGYLVFAQGNVDTCGAGDTIKAAGSGSLTASAFQVDSASQDVAVIPVISGDLTTGTADLTKLGPDSLTAVGGAVNVAANNTTTKLYLRYGVDGKANSGVDTRVAVWSTGDQSGSHTVNVYDDKQNRKSVNFTLTNAEQDWFDPETIEGLPATFTDGFIEWAPALKTSAGAAVAGSVFGYSVIYAPAFGAVQSILGAAK